MSQHWFKNQGIEVLMGYDRPLDYVFCSVWKDQEMIYSNLADPHAGTGLQDVDYFREVLADLQLSIPETMYAGVIEDQRNRTGNRVVQHPSSEQ